MSGSDINDKGEPKYPDHPDDKSNMTLEELVEAERKRTTTDKSANVRIAKYLGALVTFDTHAKAIMKEAGLEESYEEIKEIVRKELV